MIGFFLVFTLGFLVSPQKSLKSLEMDDFEGLVVKKTPFPDPESLCISHNFMHAHQLDSSGHWLTFLLSHDYIVLHVSTKGRDFKNHCGGF